MILTLIDGRTNLQVCDVEIPDGLSADGFKQQWMLEWAAEDAVQDAGSYLLEGKESGGTWFPIPSGMRLVDSGLQEGAFIRVKSVYSTVPVSVQEESSLPLFRNEYE
ncbi:hypothetical protein [Paenibacillus physcomitrellae]|uniref:Uncharacterized protein n=1 Tax=Paenibacillus physcomitrellae TaxID=1619311 RepID=A0ABQ1G8K6_9BACL|nr:hypothetical protein [Paenibacillus physcomitrellae]GGA38814.1 hypothetical protein GCM10010917_25070 [Paenibacillus physcomitrellae]